MISLTEAFKLKVPPISSLCYAPNPLSASSFHSPNTVVNAAECSSVVASVIPVKSYSFAFCLVLLWSLDSHGPGRLNVIATRLREHGVVIRERRREHPSRGRAL
jgi:hypothetical protein